MLVLTHLDRLRKEPMTSMRQVAVIIELHKMQTAEGVGAISQKLFGSQTYVSRMLAGNVKHYDIKCITLANYLRIEDAEGFLLLCIYANEEHLKKNLTSRANKDILTV